MRRKDFDFCFFDKCLGGVAQSTSGLLRRVTPALLRSLSTKKTSRCSSLVYALLKTQQNRTREEKKRFRSRQTASKQGTNHSDSYSRRIDLPRSNAVAREARTFAYVPLRTPVFRALLSGLNFRAASWLRSVSSSLRGLNDACAGRRLVDLCF